LQRDGAKIRRRYGMLVFRRIFAMIHKWIGLHRLTLNQRTQTLSEREL
jgi:hypothetical protein